MQEKEIPAGKERIPSEGKTCREREDILQEKERPAGKDFIRRKNCREREGILHEKERLAWKASR